MEKENTANNGNVPTLAKRKYRFKAGSELADKVNRANIIFDDYSKDGLFNLKYTLELIFNDGTKVYESSRLKKKMRFKAGADLTEKVNLTFNGKPLEIKKGKNKTRFKAGADLSGQVNVVEVDYIDEVQKDSVYITIDIKTSK